jgi:putative ABC transport system permease protein
VYYTLTGEADIQTAQKTVSAAVDGGPSYLDELGHFTVVEGRMFNDTDVIAHRKVALVSQSLALKLFGRLNPIGQYVEVGGTPLRIIGVTQSTQLNLLAGILGSDALYLPATTCSDLFPGWGITEMDIQVKPGVDKTELSRRIVMALNIHAHNAQAFEDSSGFLAGIEKTVGTITAILTAVVGAIAGIALLVGGIGVMNIMLVSVTERTQEIGIRMSLGATRRAILTQFLVESVVITMIGGGLGIALGVLAAAVVHWTTPLPTEVSWWVVVGSFLFSGVIGVLCGLYPANKAARQNPIDALRYE